MLKKYKIAGSVVLYMPDAAVIDNIKSYLEDVSILYVVDNSEIVNVEIVEQIHNLGKVVYIYNGENLGIARALNIAAEKAIEEGYDFLLTMDQDSCAFPRMVDEMLVCLAGQNISKIAIVSPFHLLDKDKTLPGDEDCELLDHAMASGNLLDLSAYRTVGPFLDDLFIDFVDIEFCLRLRQNGFLVVQANRAILRHSLGDITRMKILHKQLRTSNHSPLRRYYSTRNRFYVWNKYKEVDVAKITIARDRKSFRGEIRNILLLEKNKIAKIVMMLKGFRDFRNDVYGKYRG